MRSMTVFNYLLEATLFGSVLILLLVTVRMLFRGRLGSRAVYAGWGVAALRLLTPLSFPNPVMDEFRPGFSTDTAARPVADQVRQRIIDAGHALGDLMPWDGNPAASFAARLRSGASGRWFLFAWAVIAVLVGAFLWVRYERYAQNVRRNRVRALEGEELEVLDELLKRYRIRRKVRVYYVDRITSGCIAGVWDPIIALPLGLPKSHLRLALAHQLCHFRSNDHVWGMVRGICCAVHWFNPIVWMGAWLSYGDGEMACDDRVTAKLPDIDRLAYADVIVSNGANEIAMSMGATVTDKHLRQRVTSVIRCVKGSRVGIALGALLTAVVLVLSFATSESEPLPTVQNVPVVTWMSAAVPVSGDMDAIARARQFLESGFVGQDTEACSFMARLDGTLWRVSALHAPNARPLTLVYSRDGYLLEYDGTAYLQDVTFADPTYTHRTLTESVDAYLGNFVLAQLPGLTYRTAVLDTDARSGDVRLLSGRLLDENGESVCMFQMQVEPEVRMIYCRPVFAEESNG